MGGQLMASKNFNLSKPTSKEAIETPCIFIDVLMKLAPIPLMLQGESLTDSIGISLSLSLGFRFWAMVQVRKKLA